jgi:type II secretory pathway pseudopilin PulG
MIEVMMVLSIVALITIIVLLGVSEAQKSRRDVHRKAYAHLVYEALEEYYKNNGRFPGCTSGCGLADITNFMEYYLPNGTDSLTGLEYHSLPLVTTSEGASPPGQGIASASNAVIYHDNRVHHNLMPGEGQILIATAHWCYKSNPDIYGGPTLAGDLTDRDLTKFVILVYQERGGYYCLDNYSP